MSSTAMQGSSELPWFKQPEYEAHEALFTHLLAQASHDKKRYVDRVWRHYKLFDRVEQENVYTRGDGVEIDEPYSDRPRLALNVVRGCVNTVHAKIIQNKPRPTFLTIGQQHNARTKAKKTQAYVDGAFYHANAYDVAAEMGLHALIFGTACGYTWTDAEGKPCVENVFINEMRVDSGEANSRQPRNMYRLRTVNRYDFEDEYDGDAESQKMIRGAPTAPQKLRVYGGNHEDDIVVCDAYRAPSAPGKDDGRHITVLENGTLLDEKWTRRPPFVWLRWGLRPKGFFGYGISEQLEALQFEINMLLIRVQEQMSFAGPKVFVERGSSVNPDDIASEIWGIIEYSGKAPEYSVFASVSPEILQQIAALKQDAYDEIGVSQLAARSEKPAGLNSGKALLTFSDLESAKFVQFGQGYERLLRDIAEQFVWLALDEKSYDADDDSDKKKKAPKLYYPVKRYRTRFLESISRSDIVSSTDEYMCQIFPTSALAQTPAAKMQQVGEMSDKGWIPPEVATQLLDFPDLENQTSLMSSDVEYIDFCIDRMLEDGQPMRPEPWVDMAKARQRMTMALLRAQLQGEPEERWQLLVIYINECTKKLQPPAPPPGAPPPGGPPAALPPGPPTPPSQ